MKKISSKIYIFLVFLFLYAPIFVLIANSFNQSKSRTVWTGFTLDWYKKLFNNEVILKSLLNTLIVAAIASVISTILGTAAAIGIYKMKKIARSLIINITYIPIMNSEMVTGVSLMLLFVALHIDLGYFTLLCAHSICHFHQLTHMFTGNVSSNSRAHAGKSCTIPGSARNASTRAPARIAGSIRSAIVRSSSSAGSPPSAGMAADR